MASINNDIPLSHIKDNPGVEDGYPLPKDIEEEVCRACKGKRYVGFDGHTCPRCDGSGYEIV